MSLNAIVDKSVAKGPPLWSELSEALVAELAIGDEELRAELLKNTGAVSGFLRLAQMYEARFKLGALERFIERMIPDRGLDPGPLHTLLLQIPWSDIFTTNVDRLLEKAADNEPLRSYSTIVSQSEIPRKPRPRVVKLHGTIGTGQRLIFTEEDFRTYPRDYPAFVNTVQQAIMETMMVLIGFSGDDPNFLRWTGWVRDHLGDFSHSIYLVGDFRDGISHKEVLEQYSVVPVDLGEILPEELTTGLGAGRDDIADRLEWWLRYLLEGEDLPMTVWPRQLLLKETLSKSRTAKWQESTPQDTRQAFELVQSEMPFDEGLSFFGNRVLEKQASRDSVCAVVTELQNIRDTYRKWIVAPPDCRDEVAEALQKNWLAHFEVSSDFDLAALSPRAKIPHVPEFLMDCLAAMKTPDFKEAMRDLYSSAPNGDQDLNDDARRNMSLQIDGIRSWIDQDLTDCVIAFINSFLWLCDTIFLDWPRGTSKVVLAILENSAPNRKDTKLSLSDEMRRELALGLLRRYRNVGARKEKFDQSLTFFKGMGITYEKEAELAFERDVLRGLWFLDRGDRVRARKAMRPAQKHIEKLGSHQKLRLASLLDETADGSEIIKACEVLRNEAYNETRSRVNPNRPDFEASSIESWILALEDNPLFAFIATDARKAYRHEQDVRTRLDQLVSLRCEPKRDLRRAQRGQEQFEHNRHAVRAFDRAGFPMATQTLKGGKLERRLTLNGFIWHAMQSELQHAARFVTNGNEDLGDDHALDLVLVRILKLLLRYGSDPDGTRPDGWRGTRNFAENGLRDLSEAGGALFRLAGAEAEVDFVCLHHALDTIDLALESSPSSDPERRIKQFSLELGLIAFAAITSSIRSQIRSGSYNDRPSWSIGLAEKAVRTMNRIRRISDKFEGGGPVVRGLGVANWQQLIEELFGLTITKALLQKTLVPTVFEIFWEGIDDAAGRTSATYIEPFRLVQKPDEPLEAWEVRNLKDALARFADDGPQINAKAGAELIRWFDAARDWGGQVDDEAREAFAAYVRTAFRDTGEARPALQMWEWLLIDEVRDAARRRFRAWAFEGDTAAVQRSCDICSDDEVTENLYWAVCQQRARISFNGDQIRDIFRWINRLIDEHRREEKLTQIRSWPRLTQMFQRIIDTPSMLRNLDDSDFELTLATLHNLHAINAAIEPVVPLIARKFAKRSHEETSFRRLGSLLRKGLAMAHYPAHSDQFDRAIHAALAWVEYADPDKGRPMPPPALLGALGQTLAIPEVSRGDRVLRSIRRMIANGKTEGHIQFAIEIIVDLRQRVDGLLHGWEKADAEEMERRRTAYDGLQKVCAALRDSPVASDLQDELKRLEDGINALRSGLGVNLNLT